MPKPVVLCILDGWGLRDDPFANAPKLAQTPNFDRLWAECPHATLITHGPDAGLPSGQMGNSEVGHTNIGAGRVVAMDLGQIDLAIEDGTFARNGAIQTLIARLKETGGTAHLLGIVSNGGVHGMLTHLLAAARLISDAGVPVAVHAMTDGRDVAPTSAGTFVAELEAGLPDGARVATVIGRYYAMDRDNRWERVKAAYDAVARAEGVRARDAATAVALATERGETDEFIAATVIDGHQGLREGDGLFCLNFRADRAREILEAIGNPDFQGFERGEAPRLAARLGMVNYSERHDAWFDTAFPKQEIRNTLGEWVAGKGLRQFRLAETEKYPHVTFFLNGGVEAPYPGEDRHMAPSPKVATYDLQPEMAASEVTDHLVRAIEGGFDLIVVNYANPDMVGHTGDLSAAIKACEAVDQGLARVVGALEQAGGAMIVTADHGNCELMIDPETGGPHTAHTTNPVPFMVIDPDGDRPLRSGGALCDVGPTVLSLLGLEQPKEMTGVDLRRLEGSR